MVTVNAVIAHLLCYDEHWFECRTTLLRQALSESELDPSWTEQVDTCPDSYARPLVLLADNGIT